MEQRHLVASRKVELTRRWTKETEGEKERLEEGGGITKTKHRKNKKECKKVGK